MFYFIPKRQNKMLVCLRNGVGLKIWIALATE